MKKFLILFLFFNKCLNGIEKSIIKYEGKKLNVSRQVLILEDETKSIKDEDLIKGLYDHKFKVNKDNLLYLRNKDAIYYIKLDIQNLFNKNILYVHGWFGPINLNNTEISYIYSDKGKIFKKKFTRKFNENDEKNFLNWGYCSFNILPNQIKTIYIKTRSPLTTPLTLTSLENIIGEEINYLVLTNLFSGASLIILLIIVGLYLKLRKKYLLYYVLVFTFNYLNSSLFLRNLKNYLGNVDISIVYIVSVVLYIFFLVNFVIDVLKLDKVHMNIKSCLDFMRYSAIGLGLIYLLGIINFSDFIHLRGYVYLVTFNLILYVAIKRYKDDWLYKAFFFSWLPHWFLHAYLNIVEQFNFKILISDIRLIDYLDMFVNLLSIAAVLIYNEIEIKKKYMVEDQEKIAEIINGADNLMHGLLTIIHAYKKYIKFDRVMYFRKKVDRGKNDVLYYDFSIPLTLEERKIEKEYFDLSKQLSKDEFKEYYICDDIQNSEIYKKLLPNYKSMIALRVKFVEGEDLGYMVILSDNSIEYEYNEVMKDFRYKASLLTQYFKTIEDIREKYGSIIVEETLRNFHVEVLRDAEKDVSNTLAQLEKIRTLSEKYVVANDPEVKRTLSSFYDNLEKLMVNLKKDLTFDNPAKKTKKKINFKYNIIEEMLNYLGDIIRINSNKVNLKIVHKIDSDYELFGHIKIVRSIIDHYLNYLYNKIIKNNIESSITITTSLEAGKLKIDTEIRGLYISEDQLRKEYNGEVHRVLVSNTRSKFGIVAYEESIHIIYLLNLLTVKERSKFNIPHVNYDEEEQEQEQEELEEEKTIN